VEKALGDTPARWIEHAGRIAARESPVGAIWDKLSYPSQRSRVNTLEGLAKQRAMVVGLSRAQ